MSRELKSFIQILFQMVWADGVVTSNEVASLLETLQKLGLSHPEVICLLDQNLTEKPTASPPPIHEIFPDKGRQMQALTTVMRVCLADGKLQPEVLGYLEGNIIRMGVSAEELESIRKAALHA